MVTVGGTTVTYNAAFSAGVAASWPRWRPHFRHPGVRGRCQRIVTTTDTDKDAKDAALGTAVARAPIVAAHELQGWLIASQVNGSHISGTCTSRHWAHSWFGHRAAQAFIPRLRP